MADPTKRVLVKKELKAYFKGNTNMNFVKAKWMRNIVK